MSNDKYFAQFPIITYSNSQVVDITKRVAFLDSVSQNPYVFYPYEITSDERADQFSNRYYLDSYKSWIVYLSNKIIDPYYEWYLNNNEFDNHLNLKYGSIQHAYEKIVFYRNNWSNATPIDVNNYNVLPPTLQLYWQPNYNNMGSIVSYQRKQEDLEVNTNRIVSYTIANSAFINNEVCTIYFNSNNTGTGQVLVSNSGTLFLQHIKGVSVSNSTIIITANSYIFGTESGVNTSFSNTTIVIKNLLSEEEVYYDPIYIYDYETEKNEYNKTIRVIDNRYSGEVVKQFKKLIK